MNVYYERLFLDKLKNTNRKSSNFKHRCVYFTQIGTILI